MLRRGVLSAMFGMVSLPVMAALPKGLVSPGLRIAPGGAEDPRVALTLDACMGEADMRIIGTLIAERLPATIFVTGRWLANNAETLKLLRAHRELFQLENHGAMHVPAVTEPLPIYGIRTAGSLAAVIDEVAGGAMSMAIHGAGRPTWYRDATALYSPDAIMQVRNMGYRIAGFSLNADFGASLPADMVVKRMLMARDGDVIIGHVNQPKRHSGIGIAQGVRELKAKGYRFVRLADVVEEDVWGEGDHPKGETPNRKA